MKAIKRLYQYLTYKGIPPTRLEKEIGLSNGYLGTMLKREADIGESTFVKIIDYCLDLNPMWFVLGKGEMIIEKTKASHQHKPYDIAEEPQNSSPQKCLLCQEKDKRIDNLQRLIETQSEYIDHLKEQSPAGNAGQKRKAS